MTEIPDPKNEATEPTKATEYVCNSAHTDAGRALRAREGGRAIPNSQVTRVKIRSFVNSGSPFLSPAGRMAAGCQRSTQDLLAASLSSPFSPLAPLLRFEIRCLPILPDDAIAPRPTSTTHTAWTPLTASARQGWLSGHPG